MDKCIYNIIIRTFVELWSAVALHVSDHSVEVTTLLTFHSSSHFHTDTQICVCVRVCVNMCINILYVYTWNFIKGYL